MDESWPRIGGSVVILSSELYGLVEEEKDGFFGGQGSVECFSVLCNQPYDTL